MTVLGHCQFLTYYNQGDEGVLSLIGFEVDSAPEDPGIPSLHRPDDQRGGLSSGVEHSSLGTNRDSHCFQDNFKAKLREVLVKERCLIIIFLLLVSNGCINFLSKASRRLVRPVTVSGGSTIKPAGANIS